jgi:uncharacterized protein DUF1707
MCGAHAVRAAASVQAVGELPDIRATDADRERTADVLRRSGANGQLTVDELDERVELAYAAKTRGELERLTQDLGETRERPDDVPVRPGDDGTHWVVSVMGGSDRKGRWRLGRTVTVINVMGGSDLQLNDAEFAADVVEMRVFSLMGGSDIWIPEGLDVEVSEFAFMGGNEIKVGEQRPGDGGPLLKLKVISIMGGSTVRRGRKRSRRERRLERERRRHGLHGPPPPEPPDPPRHLGR